MTSGPESKEDSTPAPAKPLRRGWTTGACATAAAKAAFEGLLTGRFPDPVEIVLPKGQRPGFALAKSELRNDEAMAGIIKDAGDDPDVTHLALVQATVRRLPEGSGVQFRAQMLGKTDKRWSEFESFGYQADMDYGNTQTGALIECCSGPGRGPRPRPFRASMGMSLRTAPTETGAPMLIGAIGDPAALKASVNTGGWNQVHIVARGNLMMYFMNGKLMSTLIDDTPGRAMTHGRLAIQLEGGGDKKVSYRNLWLKTYD